MFFFLINLAGDQNIAASHCPLSRCPGCPGIPGCWLAWPVGHSFRIPAWEGLQPGQAQGWPSSCFVCDFVTTFVIEAIRIKGTTLHPSLLGQ